MGEGHSPRWRVLGAVLAVLLLGTGGYQLFSDDPTTAPPPQAAAAAADEPAVLELGGPGFVRRPDVQGPSLHLGRHLVTLRGPVVAQPHREVAASVLGRVHPGWLVRVTSTSCRDASDAVLSYGTVRTDGRFRRWHLVDTRRGPGWRSPDRTLVLLQHRARLELRRTADHRVVGRYSAVA